MRVYARVEINPVALAEAAETLQIPPGKLQGIIERIFTPTKTTRAPVQRVFASAETEVRLAIAAGSDGFRGGWVSSIYLDRLIGDEVPRIGRRALMLRLGYDWPPSLREGRTNNPVSPDGGRPRLYVHHGHPAKAITRVPDIERAYTAAQMGIAA